MLTKKWQLADPMPRELVRRYKGMSAILAQVLYNRGFHTPEEAIKFLSTRKLARNPFQMKGISQAVSRIRQAIKNKERIAVYGDYDADGVTSTALMLQILRAFDADVIAYIPNRFAEGYGLNIPALEGLASKGGKLVITVDCGIRSVEEVEAGKAAGLDMIITDHHSIGPEIPNALPVINPKQEDCPYPEKMLAGVGVAFRLAQALLRASAQNGLRPRRPIVEQDLLDLVAIGTVADVMPLNHLENRVLVRAGLEVIRRTNRPGIKALLKTAGVKPENVDATTIGFIIGPRINAAGRLDSAMLAVDLLLAESEEEATQKAQELNDLNQRRQKFTREARALIDAQIADELEHGLPLIFAGDDSLPEGIVGLVAGRLTEAHYRPSVIYTRDEREARASCRSIPEFDITHALDQCAGLLTKHGGHSLAAGFTVPNENLPVLQERLTALAAEVLSGQILQPSIHIDCEVNFRQLTYALIDELRQLEPTGHGNPAPLFITRNVEVIGEPRTVGQDNRHIKLTLGQGNSRIDAIGFRLGDWAKDIPNFIDIAYYLELNQWNGRKSLQLNLQDIRPAGEMG